MLMELSTLTFGAYPYELQLVTQNVKSLKLADARVDSVDRKIEQIVHPAAMSTADMVVTIRDTIEPGFVLAGVQFLDEPSPRQQIQITVHSSQTDVGKSLPYYLIQGRRRRVRLEFLQLL